MALDMTTALTIRAKVDGTNQIDGLNTALGRTTSQANAASGAFGKLGALSKSIGSGLGALVPAATIAGLGALGKRAIDAADNLNDLSKRTGVGVESLSRFGAAAADSGTSVDEVAKAMSRLARGVVDPASQASKTLQSIGVSAIDANGKVRSLDQIMLSVSDVFAKMPDGAQKTALAMEIFGKAGANLIPMLNEGSTALGQYSATIDTEMAQAADKFNDSINAIAIAVSGPFNEAVTALLPLITSVAQTIAGLAEGFAALPEPLQQLIAGVAALAAAFVILAPAIQAIATVWGALTAVFAGGAIFATISGYLGALVPALAAVGAAFKGLLAIVAGVLSGPVGWIALLVAAGIAIYAFRDQIATVLKAIAAGWQMAGKAFYSLYVEPLIKFGKVLVTSLTGSFAQLGKALQAPFTGAVNAIKSIFRGLLQFIANGINNSTRSINALIAGYNRLPSADIPLIPQVSVPAFAAGGVVSGPTLAMVGEGGEREYIVPESKMATAAANYLGGMRGRSVIPAFADGGVVGPMGGGGAANTTVQITTGPVLQQDGQRYVTIGDLERALSDFGTQIFKNSRSYGGRRYQGAY
jgi:hypothetical protein